MINNQEQQKDFYLDKHQKDLFVKVFKILFSFAVTISFLAFYFLGKYSGKLLIPFIKNEYLGYEKVDYLKLNIFFNGIQSTFFVGMINSLIYFFYDYFFSDKKKGLSILKD